MTRRPTWPRRRSSRRTNANLTASFTARAPTIPTATIESYAWKFGDNTTGTRISPNHTYAAAGTYQVELTVTDDDGATDTIIHDVTVTAPAVVARTRTTAR